MTRIVVTPDEGKERVVYEQLRRMKQFGELQATVQMIDGNGAEPLVKPSAAAERALNALAAGDTPAAIRELAHGLTSLARQTVEPD